jgi:hypothetical protein
LPLIDDADPGHRRRRAADPTTCTYWSRPDSALRRSGPATTPPRTGGFVVLASGLVLTSPARTLVHCARLLSHEALVCAVDAALHRDLVTREQMVAAAVGHRGEPGAPALRRAVALADGRSESPAETLARLLLRRCCGTSNRSCD